MPSLRNRADFHCKILIGFRAEPARHLKRSRVVLLLNVLIVVAVIAGLLVLAVIALGGVESVSSLSIGTPTTTTSGGVTDIVAPISLANHGYLSFSNVAVDVSVKDASGLQILAGAIGPFTVAPGQTEKVNATLVLDTARLSSAALQSLATSNQNLTVSASLGASLPPFVGVSGSVTAQVEWKAPISSLNIGQPTFTQYNSTTLEAAVPVSFENQNSFFTITGDGQISVLNSTGEQVGSGTVSLDVAPNTQFSQSVDLFLDIPQGQFQSLATTDQTLGYTVVLSLPAGGGSDFTLTEPISYDWGAPLKGLSFGTLTTGAYNLTSSTFSTSFAFTDGSAFFNLGGSLSGYITDSSGNSVGTVSPLSVSASPGQQYSGTVSGFMDTSAVGEGTYVLHLTLTTTYGTVTLEETVNG
jgi:hypothetical protein